MTIYESLDFSYNWNNKLECDIFTTVRLHWPKKYFAGAKKTVYLKKQLHSNIVIIEVVTLTLAKIKPWIKMMDVGYEKAEEFDTIIKTMYKNKNINWDTQLLDVCICHVTERIKTQ